MYLKKIPANVCLMFILYIYRRENTEVLMIFLQYMYSTDICQFLWCSLLKSTIENAFDGLVISIIHGDWFCNLFVLGYMCVCIFLCERNLLIIELVKNAFHWVVGVYMGCSYIECIQSCCSDSVSHIGKTKVPDLSE